jgi:hypothetical protein
MRLSNHDLWVLSLTNSYSGRDETIMQGINFHHILAHMILTCDLKMRCVDSHRNYRTLVRPQVYSASFEGKIGKPLLMLTTLQSQDVSNWRGIACDWMIMA